MLKKEVKLTHYRVSPFATVSCLVTEKVDLPWNGLTANPKDTTLPRSEEVNRAWLHGVGGVVNLLWIVEGVMHFNVLRVGRYL